MKKIFSIVFLSLITTVMVMPSITFAIAQVNQYVPLAPIPNVDLNVDAKGNPTGVDFSAYALGVFKLMIGGAGVLAVVMIVWGGFQYLSTDAIFGQEEGKHRIHNALWGLLLAVSAWVILNTIDPRLLKFDFTIETIPLNTSPTKFIRDVNQNSWCFYTQDVDVKGNVISGVGANQTSVPLEAIFINTPTTEGAGLGHQNCSSSEESCKAMIEQAKKSVPRYNVNFDPLDCKYDNDIEGFGYSYTDLSFTPPIPKSLQFNTGSECVADREQKSKAVMNLVKVVGTCKQGSNPTDTNSNNTDNQSANQGSVDNQNGLPQQ